MLMLPDASAMLSQCALHPAAAALHPAAMCEQLRLKKRSVPLTGASKPSDRSMSTSLNCIWKLFIPGLVSMQVAWRTASGSPPISEMTSRFSCASDGLRPQPSRFFGCTSINWGFNFAMYVIFASANNFLMVVHLTKLPFKLSKISATALTNSGLRR